MVNTIQSSISIWRRNRKIRRELPEIWLFDNLCLGYIQIPKVATRSIQERLARFYMETNKLSQTKELDKKTIKSIEEKTAYHTSHKHIKEIAETNFIFSFVRNPYSRIFSAYNNKVLLPLDTNNKNILFNHGIYPGMEFKKFIHIVCSIPDYKIDRHLRSQSWFLTNEDELITNNIGKLENFETDWKQMLEKYSLTCPNHKNSSKNTNSFLRIVDDEAKEMIKERYKSDFMLFNYEY